MTDLSGRNVGAVCVLLHAAGSSPKALGGLADRLGAEGVQCVAPALPRDVVGGAGNDGQAFAAQIAAVRAALDTAGRGRRILVGHSFGGVMALLTLLGGAEADAVVLYEPIVLSVLDDTDPADRAARAWDKAVIDQIATAPDGVIGFIEAYNEVSWDKLPERARGAILGEAPAIERLARAVHTLRVPLGQLDAIDVPTLVLSGDSSPEVTQIMARRLSMRWASARYNTLPGVGHMAPVLRPDAVADAIVRFITERAA